jgi:O-antigen biosynthesis protein WbqP
MLFIKRIIDCTIALIGMVSLALPMLVISLVVKCTSSGPILYWSKRIGRNNVHFRMPKFRTMLIDTPAVATHLLNEPKQFLTPVGGFLRKSSLDELPQLLNILLGEMSLIGPRPALFNQKDLIKLRTEKGVHTLTPGLTGWAQINGRDELPIPEKVEFDEYYLRNQSIGLETKILLLTFKKVMKSEGVTH